MRTNWPTVTTSTGKVRGRPSRNERVFEYLGIPYAEPPVGDRRFKPPSPHKGWDGVFDAYDFGHASAQVFDPHEADAEEYGEAFGVARNDTLPSVGSEDSLTLNVWTAHENGDSLPVLVWIHGGANWLESSRLSCYHGGHLAAHGHLVVVSLNYRLGMFGFLDISPLCEDGYSTSGFNGLLDQKLAIEWVIENIERFGGDPTRITLAGESAGSMDITWLAVNGLLPKQIKNLALMSGVASVVGYGKTKTVDEHSMREGQRRSKGFLKELGITSKDQLLRQSAQELLKRHADFVQRSSTLFDHDTLFYPRVDGIYLTSDPFEGVRQGRLQGYNVLIGFTENEMGLWLNWEKDLDSKTPEEMATLLPSFPQDKVADVAQFYRNSFPMKSPQAAAMRLLGDACFVMPSIFFAKHASLSGCCVWVYEFGWFEQFGVRGAQHASDLGFFLGTNSARATVKLIGKPQSLGQEVTRLRLEREVGGALKNFVHSGNPAFGRDLEWPRYQFPTHSAMHFENQRSLAKTGNFEVRWEWWAEHVFASIDSITQTATH